MGTAMGGVGLGSEQLSARRSSLVMHKLWGLHCPMRQAARVFTCFCKATLLLRHCALSALRNGYHGN